MDETINKLSAEPLCRLLAKITSLHFEKQGMCFDYFLLFLGRQKQNTEAQGEIYNDVENCHEIMITKMF